MKYLVGELAIAAIMITLAYGNAIIGNDGAAFSFTLIAGVAIGFAGAILMDKTRS